MTDEERLLHIRERLSEFEAELDVPENRRDTRAPYQLGYYVHHEHVHWLLEREGRLTAERDRLQAVFEAAGDVLEYNGTCDGADDETGLCDSPCCLYCKLAIAHTRALHPEEE